VSNLTFRVTGVSYENETGKDIQKLLHKIRREIAEEKGIELYSGLSNSEILEYYDEVPEFEDVEFGEYIVFKKDPNNEYDPNAIKVYIELDDELHHIGHVPRKYNKKLENYLIWI
jgi:hypothetical protein